MSEICICINNALILNDVIDILNRISWDESVSSLLC